jgi:hypothetical protein
VRRALDLIDELRAVLDALDAAQVAAVVDRAPASGRRGVTDLSPAAIEGRLAEVERLRRQRWAARSPDMSEAAITARLETVGQLLRLCRALGGARRT